jgi:hypothetical protein
MDSRSFKKIRFDIIKSAKLFVLDDSDDGMGNHFRR